jgi:hypothetical protein
MPRQGFQRDTPQNLLGYGGAQVFDLKMPQADIAGSYLRGSALKQEEEEKKRAALERQQKEALKLMDIENPGFKITDFRKATDEEIAQFYKDVNAMTGGNMSRINEFYSELQPKQARILANIEQRKLIDDDFRKKLNEKDVAANSGVTWDNEDVAEKLLIGGFSDDLNEINLAVEKFSPLADWKAMDKWKMKVDESTTSERPNAGEYGVYEINKNKFINEKEAKSLFESLKTDIKSAASLERDASKYINDPKRQDAFAGKGKKFNELPKEEQQRFIDEQMFNTFLEYQKSINTTGSEKTYGTTSGSGSGTGKYEILDNPAANLSIGNLKGSEEQGFKGYDIGDGKTYIISDKKLVLAKGEDAGGGPTEYNVTTETIDGKVIQYVTVNDEFGNPKKVALKQKTDVYETEVLDGKKFKTIQKDEINTDYLINQKTGEKIIDAPENMDVSFSEIVKIPFLINTKTGEEIAFKKGDYAEVKKTKKEGFSYKERWMVPIMTEDGESYLVPFYGSDISAKYPELNLRGSSKQNNPSNRTTVEQYSGQSSKGSGKWENTDGL